MKTREWWLVASKSNGWQARVQKPAGDSVHVIESKPVLEELKQLWAYVQSGLGGAEVDVSALEKAGDLRDRRMSGLIKS